MNRGGYLFRQMMALAVIMSLPLMALLAFDGWQSASRARSAAYESTRNQAEAVAHLTATALNSAEQYVATLAARPPVVALDASHCDPVIDGVVQRRPGFANVLVLDRSGSVVCSAIAGPGAVPSSFGDTPWFQAALRVDGLLTSSPFLAPIARRMVSAVTFPIRDAQSARIGTVAVLLDLEQISATWSQPVAPAGQRMGVIDRSGIALAIVPDFARWAGRDLSPIIRRIEARFPDGIGEIEGVDGELRVFARSRPLPGPSGWSAFASVPSERVFAAYRSHVRQAALAGSAAVLAALLLAALMARRLAAPLTMLVQAVRAVAAGDPDARADTSAPGEFGVVSREFNAMLDARHLVRAQLSESERRFLELLANVDMISIMVDRDGRLTYCNDHLLQLTGWQREEVLGSSWFERFIPEDSRQRLVTGFPRAMHDGLLQLHYENDILTRVGARRHIRWHNSLLRSPGGGIVGIASLGEDITERVQLAARERRHTDFYAALSRTNGAIVRAADAPSLFGEVCQICVDHGHASIAYVSLVDDGVARTVASAGAAGAFLAGPPLLLDPAPPAVRGMTATAIREGRNCIVNDVYADDRTMPWRAMGEAIGTRSVAAFPFRRGGNVTGALTLHMRAVDFFDDKLVALVDEMAADISFALDNLDRATQLRTAERALAVREKQLSGLVETAMDAIISIDAEQRVVLFNHAAAAMFRLPGNHALGQPIERFLPERLRAAHRAHVSSFGATGTTARRMGQLHMLTGVRADGEEFPIEASISKLGEGAQVMMTVVIRDATEQRRATEERLARETAESASRAKTDFLSRMSHELRTPLNAVLGFSQLLQTHPTELLSARQHGQVEQIRQAGWHLLALINDVLDVSQIEAGRVMMEERTFDVVEAIDEVLRLTEATAGQRGLSLVRAYRDSGPLPVRTDPLRVRQVLLNLLSNAVKYNVENGTITVSAEHRDDEISIEIADTGQGMTPEQVEHLFEPFNRLGLERSGIQGTGLGLALTRQLVELMHGHIEIVSESGRGTRACFTLPARDSDSHPGALNAADGAEQLHDGNVAQPAGVVLYVEDNAVNMILVEQMLARWPALRLLQAEDGASGIALARSLKPDLVLLDMQLPDMDGLAVLRALRGEAATRDLRVIALSANAMPDEIAAARRAGADDYWTKPLDFDQFLARTRSLLSRPA